jgi:hypothetical protein
MQTVVETAPYLSDAERIFTAEERGEILDAVASDPTCGVVVPGSGGIRKVRFAFGGRGKSGGARIIYFYGGDEIPIFLLAAFAKNEKSDLSGKERAALAKAVTQMLLSHRRRK